MLEASVKKAGRDHSVDVGAETKGLPKLKRVNMKNFLKGFESFGMNGYGESKLLLFLSLTLFI